MFNLDAFSRLKNGYGICPAIYHGGWWIGGDSNFQVNLDRSNIWALNCTLPIEIVAAVLLGPLVLIDDVVSHVWGSWMPMDG